MSVGRPVNPQRTAWTVDPPITVWVDTHAALSIPPSDPPPLRVRAGGLRTEHRHRGLLLAWYRLHTGTWVGLVRLELTSTNNAVTVEVTQLVPAPAIHEIKLSGRRARK